MEMFWNDVNDPRGFTIFDTDTLEIEQIDNPFKLFHNIYYVLHQTFDTREYENKIVKVIVRKKLDPKKFEKFIDKLYSCGIQDLKIVENFTIQENEDFEVEESENTISILNRYIDEAEFDCDSTIIKGILQKVYSQLRGRVCFFLRSRCDAYAVQNCYGEKVLFLFEEEDDAERYAMQLEDNEEAEMDVVEVDDALAILTCKRYNYKYAVVTPNDIVIPPKLDDNFPED